MSSYLVTGATRGIGFALVSALAARPPSEVSKVFAASRKENDALRQLIKQSAGRVEYVPLEITSQESTKAAAKHVEQSLEGRGLDVLINNAGFARAHLNGIENMTDLTEHFNVNVVGTHNTISAFLTLIKKGNQKKVISISSTMGSMSMAAHFMYANGPAYKISKTALNMLTVQYSETFRDEGLTFVALCPGWVKTEMGTHAADLSVEESVSGLLEHADKVSLEDTGKFLTVRVPGWEEGDKQYHGKERPW